ncbi:hypothetical protein AU187_19005 [Mycobacterium sp. IS-1556]|nr:hypothetical protein AU187_19005 [Mycobacterium sp. IS-1556]
MCAGGFPVDTRLDQIVVLGVDMENGSFNGTAHRVGVNLTRTDASLDPVAKPNSGVQGNRFGTVGWTTRKLLANRDGDLVAARRIGVGKAFARRLFDRGRLGQNALTLIASTAKVPPHLYVEPHHDDGLSAGLHDAAGQRGAARRQELELTEPSAVEAQRAGLVLEENVAGPATQCARLRIGRLKDSSYS